MAQARQRQRQDRGVLSNPHNRYESWVREESGDGWPRSDEEPRLRTLLTKDESRSVISYNRSPDIPFDRSINPYRGCEHGCVYCYARPTHAWLGFSPGLDFETCISYKPRAADLLLAELAKPGYRCQPIALGTNTDPYQPVERRLGITGAVISALLQTRHPAMIVTKSSLIERDLDLLVRMTRHNLVQVCISFSTLNPNLGRAIEPRASSPMRRLETIARLHSAGIPVGVLVAPIIPGLTEHELERALRIAREAGASFASYVLLRLPLEVETLFTEWLETALPHKAGKVMSILRQCHEGKTSSFRFGKRMRGSGKYADLIEQRFRLASKRFGYAQPGTLNTTLFTRPDNQNPQLDLFAES